jgi:hypothetical protein
MEDVSLSRLGWSWFERAATRPESDVHADVARAFLRCFSSEDGKAVLAYLRATVLERALGPAVTEAQLRHIEGQRQLVVLIANLATRTVAESPSPDQPENDD